MRVLNVQNVEQALRDGIQLVKDFGYVRESRAGATIAVDTPVTTVYGRPWERVLSNPQRDANPFFHLMESLWIIEGRRDVKFLTEFNKRMAEYSDDGIVFNAPYGFRMRKGVNAHKDQIEDVIKELKEKPDTRQAVLQIWDDQDLGKQTTDKACNMSVVFRVRNNRLDITVYNRSNDMVWGAYGANAVQFSMLQEYVSARTQIPMGNYYQVSNDFHVYTSGPGGRLWDTLRTANWKDYQNPYAGVNINDLVLMKPDDMKDFDRDLKVFFQTYDWYGYIGIVNNNQAFESKYFNDLVIPMLICHYIYKTSGKEAALQHAAGVNAVDWKLAVTNWLNNRKGATDVIQ